MRVTRDEKWLLQSADRLNKDVVMQIRGFGGCKNFVGNRQELVFRF